MENNDFDFTGIFPNCTDNFLWDIYQNRSRSTQQEFTKLCSTFKNDVTNSDSKIHNFVQYCQVLGLYLEHIYNKGLTLKPNSCCKLFYYKLKKDIIDKFALKCTYANNDCYNKMIQKAGVNISSKILGICKDHFVDIDNNTSALLDYLFEIYKDINLFSTEPLQRTTNNVSPFTKKIDKLEEYSRKNKIRLNAVLENIIQICVKYNNDWKYREPEKHSLYYISDKWINKLRMKINGTYAEITGNEKGHTENFQTKALEAETLMSTGTYGETSTGISVGMIFISFSILIIMFILYKYTTYFSFLKPRVRRLRIRLNKNNRNNMDFIYSFDFKNKNSLDGKYEISYS
ncbi:variable surface protein [Plasmodium gonderi]|uniref:Variable surface protein n=1 Tax=Plasmodium gonderi TaxID=77519 RepID=A0A1Y1JQI9_PLAGO|nr:variable surface protein [Plasmodium gonderi]GAW84470.1 variable surface protein [Plasmodium gonderi]